MPGKNPIAAVGSVRNFMSLMKEVNFDEIRDRAEQAPRVLVVGRTEDQAHTAARGVFGHEGDQYIELKSGERASNIDSGRYDVIVVTDPDGTKLYDEVRKSATGGHLERMHFLSEGASGAERLRREIVMTDPDQAPAFGRWFPQFRAAAVHAIIDETAKANAKFALISSAPSVVPILGSFVSASTDMIVLTKNQVMMAYKLAAANGRDLHDHTGILRELAPVVGAGFVWRSVAREAVSFLPFMAGALPKVGIAFAGTYSTGKAVDYYYKFGKKPSGETLAEYARQAMQLAEKLPIIGKDGPEDVESKPGSTATTVAPASADGDSTTQPINSPQ